MGALHSTESSFSTYSEREKCALLGLWSVPGVGPKTIKWLRAWAGGSLEPLLDLDVTEFANGSQVPLTVTVRKLLCAVDSLERAAEQVVRRAEDTLSKIRFIGEPGYPQGLALTKDAPPVLFVWGDIGLRRRRVAMVGSRNPSNFFVRTVEKIAFEVAAAGVGVVSGGAQGVDAASHTGAIAAGGETWAFVGSSLDQLDAVPWRLVTPILKAGGAILSEYPPGVRSDKSTFPRRNRLISGASDVTVVMRAAAKSGALHTAEAALKQGRPVLAMPGEVTEPTAVGCNDLLRMGAATPCLSSEDILRAVGLTRGAQPPPVLPSAELLAGLSVHARTVYAALKDVPTDLEVIASTVQLNSGALTAALVELELKGLVLQYPGRVFEKV